jgi:hypothetical protein
MPEFIAANAGTIITALVVLGVAAAIVCKLVRDKRKGKCAGCNCGCGGCSEARR